MLHSPALSLSSQGGFLSLGSFLWPFSGRAPTAPYLTCTEGSTSGRSTPSETSQPRGADPHPRAAGRAAPDAAHGTLVAHPQLPPTCAVWQGCALFIPQL